MLLISAKEARACLLGRTRKLHLTSTEHEINTFINMVIACLVENTTESIKRDIKKNMSNGMGYFVLRYDHGNVSENNIKIIRDRFHGYVLSNDRIITIYNEIWVRIEAIFVEKGYTMCTTHNGSRRRLIWSSKWDDVVSHFIIRRIVRKYIKILQEKWLSPPNGRLYLKAMSSFNELRG